MIGWIGSLLLIYGLFRVGNKSRAGFLYGAAGETLWVARAIQTSQWDLFAVCVVFVAVYLDNWRKWGHE